LEDNDVTEAEKDKDPKAPETKAEKKPETKADKKMTAAQAAKFVKRMVPVKDDKGQVVLDKDNNPKTRAVAIGPEEVMSFADYENHVVVVTTSGEKLYGEKPTK
jgi:hypothetical protein